MTTGCSTNEIIKSTVGVGVPGLGFFVSRVLVSTRVERDLPSPFPLNYFFSFFLSFSFPFPSYACLAFVGIVAIVEERSTWENQETRTVQTDLNFFLMLFHAIK